MGNTLGLGAGAGLGLGLCFGAAALMQAVGANAEHLNRGREAHANRVVNPQRQYNVHRAEDIDESSAERLYDAMRYAKANAMLIQVPVLGTAKKFWRLSDKATRISRKLALILSSQHKIGFSIERVRDDYKYLAKVLIKLIKFSGGDINNLPPDYREFLLLIGRGTVTMRDEFLIVNNVALLPMENRTEVFLMLHDRIVNYRGREDEAKRKRILSKLPYKKDWLDTARANARINEWVTFPKKGMNQGVENVREYRRTPFDLLRLNRNIRCHLHQHNNDDIEETLYCEWPELLMVMEKMLYLEGELVATDIQNKFG